MVAEDWVRGDGCCKRPWEPVLKPWHFPADEKW